MRLSVGPVPYHWERTTALAFYESLCDAPVDIVCLAEVVGSKRRLLRKEDWLGIARMLRAAGKEIVISPRALAEAKSELGTLLRMVENAGGLVEANDYACVECVAGRPFMAGPQLNVHDEAMLHALARHGAQRWVAPVELPLVIVAALATLKPKGMEVEMLARVDQPFLTLDRSQTSAAAHNLPWRVQTLRNAGVDVLRLSPRSRDFTAVARSFHEALSVSPYAIRCGDLKRSAWPPRWLGGRMLIR